MNKPPTWNSALFKAALMAALLFVFTQIGLFGGNTTIAQSLFLSLFALILYTPLAYVTDKFVYSRAQKRRAAKQG
jgi:ABC-type phosphate transport system permease subunit